MDLNKEIEESGLKKTFIAKRLGITSVYLSYMLQGKRPLLDSHRIKILKIIKS